MSKFIKKPVVIEAWKLEYSTRCIDFLIEVIGDKATRGLDGSLRITTPEGTINAVTGDYIIKGVKGDFAICKPDVFKQTYNPY